MTLNSLWTYVARHAANIALTALVALNIAAADAEDAPMVRLETTSGDITLKLYPEKSPVTVANFLEYVDSGHYDGTVFHRVISNFMIQGGGFTVDLVEKPTGEPIVNESANKLHNIRGTIAMARTNDADSATAQFFINQRSNLRLDWAPGKAGYTVFGEVVDGMSVVDFIATAETDVALATTAQGQSRFSDVPTQPIVLKRAIRVTSP